MIKRNAVLLAAALGAGLGATAPAMAQSTDWPSRLVKIVVPAPPGSVTDLLARVLSDRLATVFGQSFITDNRPGAGTNIGTDYVAKQRPDGYTILLTQNTIVTNPSFFKKLPFDPIADFDPVSLIVTTPLLLAVNTGTPVKNLRELIEFARTREITYGSAGIGSPHHLAAVLFSVATGLKMTHVPYKGSAPATMALVTNEVTMSLTTVSAVQPFIQSGKLRALAVSGEKRTTLMPDLPAIAEVVPGVVLDAWFGVFVPAGTPRAIIDRLNTEINRAIRDPQIVKTRFTPNGIEPVGTTPEYLKELMKTELLKYQKLARDANITPE